MELGPSRAREALAKLGGASAHSGRSRQLKASSAAHERGAQSAQRSNAGRRLRWIRVNADANAIVVSSNSIISSDGLDFMAEGNMSAHFRVIASLRHRQCWSPPVAAYSPEPELGNPMRDAEIYERELSMLLNSVATAEAKCCIPPIAARAIAVTIKPYSTRS